MASGAGADNAVIDGHGRLESGGSPDGSRDEGEHLDHPYSALLCAELSTLGSRTVATRTGHLGLVTMKEWTGKTLEFWAGVALRADAATALNDAARDALLTPWGGSVIVAGAARLVANGTCRAARVVDDSGVTTFGPTHDFPVLGGRGVSPEPGARLAVRTTHGDFRALSLGDASVMLLISPGWTGARRVEEWFDVLERALAS